MPRSFILGLIINVLSTAAIAQISQPNVDFRFPLDLKPSLSGAFGDLRPNHFHSGLDFRTNQREGYPVYAIADGFVSRMRVQIGGFGQAVYLDHPNGQTSVYAHLSAFNPKITKMVKDFQYRLESFEVDIPLIFSEIPVKKGEIIGWSGNTGSSGGPHLHFEIRDTKTEEALNPQMFGLKVPDVSKPEIKGIYLYQLNGEPFSEDTPKQYFAVKGSLGNYQLATASVINLSAESAFGIMAFDRHMPTGGTYGLYKIELSLDGENIYTATWNKFSFDANKAINSHLDYAALKKTGKSIQKSFVEPGNPLGLYQTQRHGLIKLADNELHELVYKLSDLAGNTSTLRFKVKRNMSSFASEKSSRPKNYTFNEDFHFKNEEVSLVIPKGAFYGPISFEYSSGTKLPGTYSPQHRIHRQNTPIHIPCTLAIKTNENLPKELQNKTVIVDQRGVAHGGVYENGFVKAEIKNFGTFHVRVDTIPPRVSPININDGKTMTGISKIVFKIADQLSGIATFKGKIDGQWVLMEYDQKTAILWHRFDEKTSPGKHQLELSVADKKGNTSIYKANFNL